MLPIFGVKYYHTIRSIHKYLIWSQLVKFVLRMSKLMRGPSPIVFLVLSLVTFCAPHPCLPHPPSTTHPVVPPHPLLILIEGQAQTPHPDHRH